jgi:hypothetical protein
MRDPRSADEFWLWFARETRSASLPPPPSLLDSILTQLHRYQPGLVFQIGRTPQGLVLEISADGNADLIPAVKELCAASPAIPGWTVRAFRQPSAAHAIKIDGNLTLTVDEIYFALARDGDRTTIGLFVDGLAANRAYGHAAVMLFEAALGELVLMTKVSAVDIRDGRERPRGARPLRELLATLLN